MNLKRHVGALVAAALLGGGLVGCAVKDEKPAPYEPQVTHTPKPKKTDDTGVDDDGTDEDGAGEDSTAEPGSEAEALEPPPIPDAIYEETLEGAEAAARYYIHALGYGFLNNDPQPLELICLDASKACSALMGEMEKAQVENYAVMGEPYAAEDTENVIPVEEGYIFEIPVVRSDFEVFDGDGESIQLEPGSYALFKVWSKYEDDRWQVRAAYTEKIDQ